MSEKIKIERCELAAVILAAALVWAPLAVPPAKILIQGNRKNPAHTQSGDDGDYPLKILTLLLAAGGVVIAGFQAWIFHHQRLLMQGQVDLMKGQLKAATKSAKAANRASKAALAALDRPWLSIEGLKTTRTEWIVGMGDLAAQFKITNHGKAPAIIASVKALLFLGYENRNSNPFAGEGISQTILPFPSSADFGFFLSQHAKWPLIDVSDNPDMVASLVEKPTSGPLTWISPLWGQKRFDSPVSLPQSASTEVYRWRESALVLPKDGKIPDDAWADVFLVGQIIYGGPTIGAETINFSYKANRFGGFQIHGRAPYNERKKGPEVTGSLGYW